MPRKSTAAPRRNTSRRKVWAKNAPTPAPVYPITHFVPGTLVKFITPDRREHIAEVLGPGRDMRGDYLVRYNEHEFAVNERFLSEAA